MIHNELRYAVDIQRAHRIAFGEPGAWGIERLGETLTPTVDLWTRPEWALLRGEFLWGADATEPAGAAGTFARIGIHNPVGSRLIVVVLDHFISGVAVAVAVRLEVNDTLLANAGQVVPADRRLTGQGGAIIQSESNAAAALPALVRVAAIPAGNTFVHFPVVLPPGRGIQWVTTDDAAPLIVSFRGYQRQAYAGELE